MRSRKERNCRSRILAASFRKSGGGLPGAKFCKGGAGERREKLVIAGGVSANSLCAAGWKRRSSRSGWNLYKPALNLCGDNAAMVGAQGYYEYLGGILAGLDLNACAEMPIQGPQAQQNPEDEGDS